MSRIMTDRELLDALDLEHPGLEAVRIAVTTGDLAAAVEQLVRYFRGRPFDADVEPPDAEDHPEVATERGEKLRRLLATRDWLSVADPAVTPERLYSTQVMVQNDHGEFAELAQAYAETGNHRYACDCVAGMLRWIDTTGPLPTSPPVGPTAPMWRTIEYVNPRLANWTRTLAILRHCPTVTADEPRPGR